MNIPIEIINDIITYQYPQYSYLQELKEKIFESMILIDYYFKEKNIENLQLKLFLFLNFGEKSKINELTSFWIF